MFSIQEREKKKRKRERRERERERKRERKREREKREREKNKGVQLQLPSKERHTHTVHTLGFPFSAPHCYQLEQIYAPRYFVAPKENGQKSYSLFRPPLSFGREIKGETRSA